MIRLALAIITLVLSVPFVMLIQQTISDPCHVSFVSAQCRNQSTVMTREFWNGLALLLALVALGVNEWLAHGRKPKAQPRKKDAYWDSNPGYQKQINTRIKGGSRI
jgi:hypothetical protein